MTSPGEAFLRKGQDDASRMGNLRGHREANLRLEDHPRYSAVGSRSALASLWLSTTIRHQRRQSYQIQSSPIRTGHKCHEQYNTRGNRIDSLNLPKRPLRKAATRKQSLFIGKHLAITETDLDPQNPKSASLLNNLGLVLRAQARYPEAEALYRKALEIHQRVSGPEHTEVTAILHNLGEVCRYQGKFVEANTLYEEAMRIREASQKQDDPEMASLLNNMGALYLDQGQYAKAESFFEKALEIGEKSLAPNDSALAATLNNLAQLYRLLAKHTLGRTALSTGAGHSGKSLRSGASRSGCHAE